MNKSFTALRIGVACALAFGAMLALAACVNGQLTAAGQADAAKACQLDAAGQPIALATLSIAEPALAPSVAAVDSPIHAAIVAECDAQAAKALPPVTVPAKAP